MESLLHELNASLESAVRRLNGDEKLALQESLHNTEALPNKTTLALAGQTLDLVAEVQHLLEPGHLILADHYLGYMSTKALCAAVELNIPDILRQEPKTLPALAKECKARADRLGQIMRTLFNNGVFSYNKQDKTYQNNHVSTLLLSDHWTQWRNWVELYGNEFYDMARGIPAACGAGISRSPAQVNYDTDDSMFKYFTDQGWIQKFHKTLSGGAIAQAPGILEDYPWEEVAHGTVIDIGGGGGGLIALLLRKFRTMTGAILEAPRVIEQARANFHTPDGQFEDVGGQIPGENLLTGDFFVSIPSFEVYTLKWCLHDWDDNKAAIILKNIRKSIKRSSKSRLIVLESVLEDGHTGRLSRYADMNMMVAVGGKERDESQWRTLGEESGWKLRKVYPLRNAWPYAIEFVPVWFEGEAPPAEKEIPSVEPGSVVAEMRFLEPWENKSGNPYMRISPDPGYDRSNFQWQDYAVKIYDARPTRNQFVLDTHGFAFHDDDILQETIDALRGNNKETVRDLYYPHIEDFVKRITGAPRVIIFDHTLRKRRLELAKTENNDNKEQPATMVHCDQSPKGALRRLKMNIEPWENVDDLLQGRVQMLKY
ncbi:uncharacterized protein N0V89_001736 [Didymosphaeria variabile]|uniref:S-adenosyl-L-methionine-dependent methyltransferase n=1 Tax=Didymosphaeria variabile TaxID=1932322 RepID=A0A9W8XR74_9PLEO|nr:uncharacterized protein N0V89_001736 [Didymosphaeria variabile]KAJ4357161.1 hypothetical protein N0V89_001736 [Didymosphaeria variabile]